MRKLLIASHSKLAQGFKDTLDFLSGTNDRVIALCAYVNDNGEGLEDEIDALLEGDDEFIVLVDSLGGSVCQQFARRMSDRVQVIAGANLPLALTLALSLDAPDLNMGLLVEEAREQIVLINNREAAVQEYDE